MGIIETLKHIYKRLRPHITGVSFLVASSVVVGVTGGLAEPFLTKFLIDALTVANRKRFLMVAILPLTGYALIRIVKMFAERLSQNLQADICETMTLEMLRSFYRLPYGVVSTAETGYFVARVYDEPAAAAAMIDLCVQIISAVFLLGSSIATCLWLSWKLAVAIVILLPAILFLSRSYNPRIRRVSIEASEGQARLKAELGRAIGAYKTVEMFDFQPAVVRRISDLMRSYFRIVRVQVRYSSAFRAVSGSLLSSGALAVLIGAGFQVLNGALTIGGLFGFVTAYNAIVGGFQNLTQLIPQIVTLGAKLERVKQFGTVAATWNSDAISERVMCVSGCSLSLGSHRILHKCDFSLRIGERVVIRGPNGSGKSTLALLLCGFLNVQEGAVRIPDRRRVSALLTPFVFVPGSVKDNIPCGGSVERLQADELIRRFGLTSRLHDDPATFSEGEKRKLQVIMTLSKSADFYIFDEPLANVDAATSEEVMQLILALTKGKGLVVIMHGLNQYSSLFDREFTLASEGDLASCEFRSEQFFERLED